MNKAKINYFVDLGLLIFFISLFITGIIKFPGLLQTLNIGIYHRDLPMYEINAIHDWSGITLGVLVFIHLMLHWNWIVVMTKQLLRGSK